jgi:putative transcriptional regulator
MPNLSLGHSLDNLVEIGEAFAPTQKIKLFAGYSGWSAGQLEDEIKRGAWLTHPASMDLVFASDASKLWAGILNLKGWKYRLLAQMPEDPSVN